MILNDKLIDILCCPHCRGTVSPDNSAERLNCVSCGQSYGASLGILEMFRAADLNDRNFVGYREAYEEHAKGRPDITQWSWMEMLVSFMGRCDGLVLDIGSGDGKLGEMCSGEVVCFDISLNGLRAAKKKGLSAVAGKAEVLPFKRAFDIVVLSNILEHVPDPDEVLKQVAYVLKPGGAVFIIVPYKEDLSWYRYEDVLDPHLTSFDLGRIRGLLEGYRITRSKFILFTSSRPFYFLKSLLKDVTPGLYKRLRGMKVKFRPRASETANQRKFPRWRNALNHLPGALVLPFMRPYLIMLEARPSAENE